ncbi:MAG: PEPxxWA-CTERM sorting domain-containing protein [Pseudomonadota bacterium]
MKTLSMAALAGALALGLTSVAHAAFPTLYFDEADFLAQGNIAQTTHADGYGAGLTALGQPEVFGDLALWGDPLLVVGTATGPAPVRNLFVNSDLDGQLGGQIFSTGYNMLSFDLANIAGSGDQVYVELFTNLDSYGYGLYPGDAQDALTFYGFVVPDGEYFLGFTMNRTDFGSNFEPTPIDQVFGLTDIALGATGQVCDTRVCEPGAAVPEPGAWALMILGFGMSGALLRARRRLPALGS